jgi:hypothetical protein
MIRIKEHDDRVSFTVEFEFIPNDYFTNSTLYKIYHYEVKDQELHRIESSSINWISADKIPNKIVKTKTIKSRD